MAQNPHEDNDPLGIRRFLQNAAPRMDYSNLVRDAFPGLDTRGIASSQVDTSWIAPAIASAIKFNVDPFAEWKQSLAKTVEHLRRLALSGVPENWHNLEEAERDRLPALAAEQALGVAFVPPESVLCELLACESFEDREVVIRLRAQAIVDECAEKLSKCDSGSLTLADLLTLGERAARAFKDGHPEAAQALSANVTDTAATQLLNEGKGRLRESYEEWTDISDDDGWWDHLFAVVVSGMGPAYERYEYNSGGAVFNRHGTAHCADLTVYSDVNAVRALTLATSLLVWLDREPFFSRDSVDDAAEG